MFYICVIYIYTYYRARSQYCDLLNCIFTKLKVPNNILSNTCVAYFNAIISPLVLLNRKDIR